MTESENRIFISYRRADTDADANALYQSLAAHFGAASIFKDVDSIPLGSDFRVAISDAVDRADIMLVLIGPDWLQPAGDRTTNLLERENDFVRIEMETALGARLPIIPILVRGAEMPAPSQLPVTCRKLADINGAELEHRSWGRDLPPVVAAIEDYLRLAAYERTQRNADDLLEVEQAIEVGEWDAAAARREELRGSWAGPTDVLDGAEQRVAEGRADAARSRRLDELAARANTDIGAARWDDAAQHVSELEQLAPADPRVRTLADRVDAGRARERKVRHAEAVRDVRQAIRAGQLDRAAARLAGVRALGEGSTAQLDALHAEIDELRDRQVGRSDASSPATPGSAEAEFPAGAGPDRNVFDDSSGDGRSEQEHDGSGRAPSEPVPTGRPRERAGAPIGAGESSAPGPSSAGGTPPALAARAWSTRSLRVPLLALGALAVVIVAIVLVTTRGGGSSAVAATLTVGERPLAPAVDEDENRVWVPGQFSGDVTVIDAVTNEVVGTVDDIEEPDTPAVSDGTVWIPSRGSGAGEVWAIDAATTEVIAKLEVGDGPRTPAVASDRIWVPNHDSDDLTVIDATTAEPVSILDDDVAVDGPLTPAVANGRVWVPNSAEGSNDVTVIDAVSGALVGTIAVGGRPGTPAVGGDGTVWIPTDSGEVVVVDSERAEIVERVDVGGEPNTPAIGDDGKVWVPNFYNSSLSVIDPDSFTSVATFEQIRSGSELPEGEDIDPLLTPAITAGSVWLPDADVGNVTVIDEQTLAIIDTVEVGTRPIAPAVAGNKVWVPHGRNEISALNTAA